MKLVKSPVRPESDSKISRGGLARIGRYRENTRKEAEKRTKPNLSIGDMAGDVDGVAMLLASDGDRLVSEKVARPAFVVSRRIVGSGR